MSTSKKPDAWLREREALELRKAGASYDQIGQKLDVSRDTARAIVMKAMQSIKSECEESAEEIRDLELARIDSMLLGLWEKARRGDVAAVDRVLRLQDRRAKLMGLDATPAQPAQASLPAGEVFQTFTQLAAALIDKESSRVETVVIPPPRDEKIREIFGIEAEVEVQRGESNLKENDFKRLVAKSLKSK